ncbi:hypothetical protein FGG08_007129 [Glutinoglossum americanum]|uniref:Altered inheritance of mitochondria protein 6 n=1 Tax=Glutinoglossum americanum TaxID=1670608 RepID=A0A9P8HWX9_9PEZI|nr:hypothetical protein FGG08_007129 [Glutinoglossum americanum]
MSLPEDEESERLLTVDHDNNGEEANAAESSLEAVALPLIDDSRQLGDRRITPLWIWRQRLMGMTVRGRRRRDDHLGAAELAVISEKDQQLGRRIVVQRVCMGWFVGSVVLALAFLVGMVMGLATAAWSNDIQQVIADWGKPGKQGEGLSWWPTSFSRDIIPIPCHSHNDYWRRVPLYSALRAGCISVEADVWLFDDDLYVGHDTSALTRNRTLRSLYVDPLVDILTKQNPSTEFANNTRNGVFDTDPGMSLTLLIDVKTDGRETWPHVVAQLESLRERNWLTVFKNGAIIPGPITVVGTGNTPFNSVIANQTYRDYFFDAPMMDMWEDPDLEAGSTWDGGVPARVLVESEDNTVEDEKLADRPFQPSLPSPRIRSPQDDGDALTAPPVDNFNSSNSYYASASFSDAVGRTWRGYLNERQLNIVRGQLRGAHRRGLKARYWDLPRWPIGKRNRIWKILVAEGLDTLNVDDLRGASKGWWG